LLYKFFGGKTLRKDIIRKKTMKVMYLRYFRIDLLKQHKLFMITL